MKSTGGIPFSGIVFDGSAATPHYRQLYAFIRDLILSGALPAGTRLPSSRELATQLDVARNTVIAAYELLSDEQFVAPAPGRGTVVRGIPLPKSRMAASGAESNKPAPQPPLRMCFAVPDVTHFPTRTWTRIVRQIAQQTAPVFSTRPSPYGNQRLRRLICAYLGAYRGVRCHEEQVFITTGGQHGLYLASSVLRTLTGDMLMEEPGYHSAREAFQANGYRLHPIPVDDAGACLEPERLAAHTGAHAVYLTPSHQFPLGGTLSLERRLRVLDWAQREESWIIEDDYDAEYRYEGEPVTALAGLDTAQRVIYVGTFSKVLSPWLRVGYVVVPESLIDRFRVAKELNGGAASDLVQAAIAEFLQGGYFQAHLKRMRALYRGKRDSLLRLLEERRVPVTVGPHRAGMHITLMLRAGTRDIEVAQRMAAYGFETPTLSRAYLRPQDAKPGLLAGFTGATDVDLTDFVTSLAAVLRREE